MSDLITIMAIVTAYYIGKYRAGIYYGILIDETLEAIEKNKAKNKQVHDINDLINKDFPNDYS